MTPYRLREPRYTEAEIRWMEEASDRNMARFFIGTPIAELPLGVRKRFKELTKKMVEISPAEGTEPASEMGRSVPVPRGTHLVKLGGEK